MPLFVGIYTAVVCSPNRDLLTLIRVSAQMLFHICKCLPFLFSFYVNDICFPPLIVTGENHSLTKKPPQRDDIVKARRRSNGAEAVETTARLQQGTIKGFTDFVSRPSPVILAGLAAMSGQQTCGAVGGLFNRLLAKVLKNLHTTSYIEQSFVIILELLRQFNQNPFGAKDAAFVISVASGTWTTSNDITIGGEAASKQVNAFPATDGK